MVEYWPDAVWSHTKKSVHGGLGSWIAKILGMITYGTSSRNWDVPRNQMKGNCHNRRGQMRIIGDYEMNHLAKKGKLND